MEYNKIIYNYIPKQHNSLLVALSDMIKTEEDFAIIDNIIKPIRIYPKHLKNRIMRCKQESLIDKIEFALEMGFPIVVINDFPISFDHMREELMPLISEYNACLYINNPIESSSEDKLILAFNDKILDCSEEKWEEIKEQSNESIYDFMLLEEDGSYFDDDDYEDDDEDDDEDEEKSYGERFEELCKLLNKDKTQGVLEPIHPPLTFDYINAGTLSQTGNSEESYNRFASENIKEEYSHTSNNETLTLSLTVDNNIIIDDGQEAIKISNDKLNFFINTLKNLVNMQ